MSLQRIRPVSGEKYVDGGCAVALMLQHGTNKLDGLAENHCRLVRGKQATNKIHRSPKHLEGRESPLTVAEHMNLAGFQLFGWLVRQRKTMELYFWASVLKATRLLTKSQCQTPVPRSPRAPPET